ncbi:MAG: PPOX class F420-dependent oxidoreductase [Oscillochloris sp.]|nr:PPOX class F420-dependent oxidoreductase [Oscillochloris sp.]
MAQVDQSDKFAALQKHQYANLFTYRKNGQAVKTPIWFALKEGKVYIMTDAGSGKIKRIRNNSRVLLGPSDARGTPRGETVDGVARLLDPSEIAPAKAALDAKYGLVKAIFDFFITLRGTERAWVEIVPA